MSSIAERVAAGAAWLDEREPGWVDRIDVRTLDLKDCTRCVGGQLTGFYLEFLVRHRLAFGDAFPLGFNLPGIGENYGPLTTAWRELIATRRATPGGAP